jgi:Uma2 family endonuclease
MAPTGGRHGRVAIRIGSRLNTYVEQEDLGEVFAAETGFLLERNPDKVRAPDGAFVAKGRLPPGDLPVGFLDIVPDLVVEVVSPSDTASYIQAKVEDWLRAGVSLAWVFYPDTRSVAVYRSLDEASVLSAGDHLQGDPVLPGFSCLVKDLF